MDQFLSSTDEVAVKAAEIVKEQILPALRTEFNRKLQEKSAEFKQAIEENSRDWELKMIEQRAEFETKQNGLRQDMLVKVTEATTGLKTEMEARFSTLEENTNKAMELIKEEVEENSESIDSMEATNADLSDVQELQAEVQDNKDKIELLMGLSDPTVESKILITTGVPESNGRNTEIIDVEDSSFKCTNLEPFPVNLHGAKGGLIDNKTPFLCGGHGSSNNYGDCYKFNEVGSWTKDQTAVLNTPRYLTGFDSLFFLPT